MCRLSYVRAVTGLISALLLVCSFSLHVSAAEAESLTLSPAKKLYTLDAGEIEKDTITVLNDGNSDYDFLIYTAPYSVKNTKYEPDFTTVRSNADAYAWIQFDKTRVHLKPGERVEVPYTVRVPSDAAPGGHYGVIFAEIQADKQDAGFGVARKKRVGSIVYATVNGKVINEGQVLSTMIDGFQSNPPLKATSLIENTGNTDFTAKTVFTVKDVFGAIKYQRTSEHSVLPKMNRELEFEWEGSPWFGIYKVAVDTTVLSKTTQASSLVFVMPKWMIVLVLLILIGGIYGAVVRGKRR